MNAAFRGVSCRYLEDGQLLLSQAWWPGADHLLRLSTTCSLNAHGLYAGLRDASQVSVEDIGETRWVPELTGGLGAETVPFFALHALEEFWAAKETLARLRERSAPKADAPDKPWSITAHLGDGAAGVCPDLETLGVARSIRRGMIDVHDTYCLGFSPQRQVGVPSREQRA